MTSDSFFSEAPWLEKAWAITHPQKTLKTLSVLINQHHGNRGVEFKGGSLHDGFGGFDGFGGSGEHLALLLLVLQNTVRRGDCDGFGGCGGFGHEGYPP